MAAHSADTCAVPVEQRCVIKFLVKENVKPPEIFRRLSLQLGDACPSKQDVYRWCDKFINGQETVVEEERSDDIVTKKRAGKLVCCLVFDCLSLK